MDEASFCKSKFLELVFLFKVTVVEIFNKQVLQMLVSSSMDAALSLFNHKDEWTSDSFVYKGAFLNNKKTQ